MLTFVFITHITVNHWYDDGRKTQKTLKFDGRWFSF